MTEYSSEFGGFSQQDIEVLHALVNDEALGDQFAALEDNGAFAELAWFETVQNAVTEEVNKKLLVSTAIAVASSQGLLDSFRITIPKDNG
jgi:hypothetical protein